MKEKCNICKNEIKKTFLDKVIGTIITINGKKHYICQACQKEHKENLKEKISE